MEKTILVIDDAQEDRGLMEAVLDERGYQVWGFADCASGLQKLKEGLPSLIILDILMPGMNGLEFFKEIRQDDATRRIPVFVVSSRAKMADVFLSMGVDGFMAKPLSIDSFLEQVDALAGRAVSLTPTPAAKPAAPPEAIPKPVASATPSAASKSSASGKKVVIFGAEDQVLQEMAKQLEQAQCGVSLVKEEALLVGVVSDYKPDLVLLDMGAELQVSIDKLVYTIDILTPKPKKGSLDPKSLAMRKTSILLYKVDKGGIAVNTDLAGNLADVEAVLERCMTSGAEKYIGLFSPFSFMSKMKDFLK